VKLLHGTSLHNRRAAAEALGRLGNRSAVPEILKALGEISGTDRALEHSLTYALIEIGDAASTASGLRDTDVRTRRAALTALDQMDGGGVDPLLVASLLTSGDQQLKETASWIIGRHPEWAQALAGFFRDRSKKAGLAPGEQAELERQLARFARAPEIQALLVERVADAAAPSPVKLLALRAMAQAGLKETPAAWIRELARILGNEKDELTAQAVATARALALSPDKAQALVRPLLAIAGRVGAPASLRLAALSAVPGGLSQVDSTLLSFLIGQLDRDQPAPSRSTAADVLSHARLTTPQLSTLADFLRTAGPLEVDRLLGAFEQATDEALGLKLVKVLGESSALSSLRVDAIKQHLAKYGPSVQTAAQGLYARLNVDAAKQKARVDELLARISTGDIRRGQVVFHSEKAACYTCHAIGYRGGNVGPDLTKVGQVRSERDLLEAIVYPSASFIRSFEPVVVATADGKVQNGLLRNETSEEILLVTGANQEVRIPRADIEEIRPSTVSIMPAGLDQQLTPKELADLVAFLKACR
jgi:putative heme-binding domain-containing protein